MSELVKFLFDGLPVRGHLVRLDDAWQELLRRRQTVGEHAPEVRALLGEMAAAGVLMHAGISFAGALVMQIFGDGPVKLAVAEVQSDLSFRATATVIGAVPEGAQLQALLNVHGRGRCAITLAPRDPQPGQQPYQGVVSLQSEKGEPLQQVSQAIEHYMRHSEQLDTRLVLAADDRIAAGLLIQRLPVAGAANLGAQRTGVELSEAFDRIALLAATLTRDELLSLGSERILQRLFWEEPLRLFEPSRPRFACSCSRERVSGMLQSLGQGESEGLIAERGLVEVGCDFCGLQYRFDAVDVGAMFAAAGREAPGSSSLN